jgi:hypothetical protein
MVEWEGARDGGEKKRVCPFLRRPRLGIVSERGTKSSAARGQGASCASQQKEGRRGEGKSRGARARKREFVCCELGCGGTAISARLSCSQAADGREPGANSPDQSPRPAMDHTGPQRDLIP